MNQWIERSIISAIMLLVMFAAGFVTASIEPPRINNEVIELR